jgi:hypothetical protein
VEVVHPRRYPLLDLDDVIATEVRTCARARGIKLIIYERHPI